MFRFDELTTERKQNAIDLLINMDASKAEKTKQTLKKNMEALQIIIGGGDTSKIKNEVASLSFGKAKEVFKFINDILLGIQEYEQRLRWNELADEFPDSGIEKMF